MKKKLSLLLALLLVFSIFAGCQKADPEKTIVIGASPSPHAEILEKAKELLAEKGYTLVIKEFTDYVLPNTALESGEIDANYFQHKPYLDDFNLKNGTNLAAVSFIHFEPLGIYAGQSSDLSNIKEGAVIAVPNDTSNEARALLLLQAQGIIKLKEGVGLEATPLDIVANPKNITIKELEAAQLPRTLQDVDFAVINGNYVLSAGIEQEPLATEDPNSTAAQTYANIIAVKVGNEELPKILALIEVMESDEIKTFIQDTFGTRVVTIF